MRKPTVVLGMVLVCLTMVEPATAQDRPTVAAPWPGAPVVKERRSHHRSDGGRLTVDLVSITYAVNPV